MFDKIVYVCNSYIEVTLKDSNGNTGGMVDMMVAIMDKDRAVLGQIDEISSEKVKISLFAEVKNGKLYSGVLKKPSMDSQIRPLTQQEMPAILGFKQKGALYLGKNSNYDADVYVDVNELLGHHFAIFGNSGSGKSCGLARLIQNIFRNDNAYPYKANFILFDISGEYSTAFSNLNSINPNYNYRLFTTNNYSNYGEKLKLPIWLLNAEDIALLLMLNTHSQLLIVETMLKLTRIFAQSSEEANKIKNHLIAKAMISILYNDQTAVNKRNDIFSILNTCSTNEFNLEATVQGAGYTRKFRECFLISKSGEFSESILVTEYITSFINDKYDNYEPTEECAYSLEDVEKALNFALISEGWYKNEQAYVDSITVKVRLHSLVTGKYHDIFNLDGYVNIEQYLGNMLISNGRRYQLININFDDMDDTMAKALTKIFTRIVFDFSKQLDQRASIPFHILVDEAHRYIRNNDEDEYLIGYNIFERVAKEGRKYGVLLGLISQRPVELSDTVISQLSNFFIFKTNHPLDLDYIKKMIPNINSEIMDKQKGYPSGIALAFGTAFKVPLTIKFDMPDPMINAENCNITGTWGNQ